MPPCRLYWDRPWRESCGQAVDGQEGGDGCGIVHVVLVCHHHGSSGGPLASPRASRLQSHRSNPAWISPTSTAREQRGGRKSRPFRATTETRWRYVTKSDWPNQTESINESNNWDRCTAVRGREVGDASAGGWTGARQGQTELWTPSKSSKRASARQQ